VSPIVGERPVSGPAGKMMRAKGFDVSSLGVADAYAGFVDVLAIDETDAGRAPALRARGIDPLVTDVMMPAREREIALARAVVEAAL
jgi:LPPG:FO 2-phospho-L-lactate transferase